MERVQRSQGPQPTDPQVSRRDEDIEIMNQGELQDAIETYIHLFIIYLSLFQANKNITSEQLETFLENIDTLSDAYRAGQLEGIVLCDNLYKIGQEVLFPKLELTAQGAIVTIHQGCQLILNQAHTLFNKVYKEQHTISEEKLTRSPLDHWQTYELDHKRPNAVFESIHKAAVEADKEFGIPITTLSELDIPQIPPWLNIPMTS